VKGSSEVRKVAVERELTDSRGRRWSVGYLEGGVRGMLTMNQIVFTALDGDIAGEERYLTVFPGYLENVDDHQLGIALSQAQTVNPPW
jgi:hypothetical protein